MKRVFCHNYSSSAISCFKNGNIFHFHISEHPVVFTKLDFHHFDRKFHLQIYPKNDFVRPGGVYLHLIEGEPMSIQFRLSALDYQTKTNPLRKDVICTGRARKESHIGNKSFAKKIKEKGYVLSLTFGTEDSPLKNTSPIPALKTGLFNHARLSDVEILCSLDLQHRPIYCSKNTLASQSSYFQSMFESNFREASKTRGYESKRFKVNAVEEDPEIEKEAKKQIKEQTKEQTKGKTKKIKKDKTDEEKKNEEKTKKDEKEQTDEETVFEDKTKGVRKDKVLSKSSLASSSSLSSFAEERHVLEIRDICYEACFLVLQYFHTGKLKIKEATSTLEGFHLVRDMYTLVEMYDREDLKTYLEFYFDPSLENFGPMVIFARLHGITSVLQKIKGFVILEMNENQEHFFKSESYNIIYQDRNLSDWFFGFMFKK